MTDLKTIIRNAIGYEPVPLSIRDHPEITSEFRTAADADGLVERISKAVEEHYGLGDKRLTGYLDATGREVREGDTIRVPIEYPFQDVHGTWSEKRVVFRNGTWIGEYLRSEKGQILPVGYGAQELDTMLDEMGSSKERYFTQHDRYRTLTVTVMD